MNWQHMAKNMQVAVSKDANVVSIELTLRDSYEATVLFDDMIDRLQSGQGIRLRLTQRPPDEALRGTG